MSNFITRVELHAGTAEDYATLHAAMAAQGFSQTIADRAGNQYYLPTAEYCLSGYLNSQQVCERAGHAAAKTKRGHSILVSDAKEITWSNLAPVKRTASRF